MGYIWYVDGTVGAHQPPVHCTVVTVYGYGGQPYHGEVVVSSSDPASSPTYQGEPPWNIFQILSEGQKLLCLRCNSVEESFNWSFSDQARPFSDIVLTAEYGTFHVVPPCEAAVGAHF